jgi:hypothetical protein
VPDRPDAPHSASPEELKARLEAERAGEPFLVYRDGDGIQHLITLDAGVERIAVGRRPEADLALTWDSEVSRLHAVLERVAGEWTVVDDGLSANGTFTGPHRIGGRRRLVEGDVLRFGRTLVTFRDPLDLGAGATSRGTDLAAVARISPAQRQVLVALCRPFAGNPGLASPPTNQDIAGALFLSVDAVKTHLRLLFAKFGIEDLPQNQKRMELVRRAMGSGLVTERDLRA